MKKTQHKKMRKLYIFSLLRPSMLNTTVVLYRHTFITTKYTSLPSSLLLLLWDVWHFSSLLVMGGGLVWPCSPASHGMDYSTTCDILGYLWYRPSHDTCGDPTTRLLVMMMMILLSDHDTNVILTLTDTCGVASLPKNLSFCKRIVDCGNLCSLSLGEKSCHHRWYCTKLYSSSPTTHGHYVDNVYK